jgi:hypothetical protein
LTRARARHSAECLQANRPVSGWGQGHQPPEAVARSASLEASRSQVYFKKHSCSSVTGLIVTVACT